MSENIFSYSFWNSKVAELHERYANAVPFPHIVLDDFLQLNAAQSLLAEFPEPHSAPGWTYYTHFNERKLGINKRVELGPMTRAIIDEMNSPRFIQFVSSLSGINGLIGDESLEGGGLHQVERGGFLNIHADFTVHPHHRDWQRRINVLIYLNKEWPDSFGGHLELWDKKIHQLEQRVLPGFNRCVIFSTDLFSFHGHPEPLASPPGVTRKSLALYYFSKQPNPIVRSTEYRSRPGDGVLKRIGIYCDKVALRSYDSAKRRFGFDDSVVSRILKLLR